MCISSETESQDLQLLEVGSCRGVGQQRFLLFRKLCLVKDDVCLPSAGFVCMAFELGVLSGVLDEKCSRWLDSLVFLFLVLEHLFEDFFFVDTGRGGEAQIVDDERLKFSCRQGLGNTEILDCDEVT